MRTRSALVTACAALLVTAGCSDDPTPGVAPSTSPAPPSITSTPEEEIPTATIGRPFVNGSFQLVITKVELGVKLIDLDATAKSGGLQPYTPENGQFIVVHATAKNTGGVPASMSSTASYLIDGDGKQYEAGGPYLGGVVGQGFEENQQPGTTRTGWIAFDVPASVTRAKTLVVQSQDGAESTAPPTLVAIG